MADYRRWRVAGGTYFFTLVAHSRFPLFADPRARTILGDNIRECQQEWPFKINAIVLLPDHLHVISTLRAGDDNARNGRSYSLINRKSPTIVACLPLTQPESQDAQSRL